VFLRNRTRKSGLDRESKEYSRIRHQEGKTLTENKLKQKVYTLGQPKNRLTREL
jgi:hypothetical protein